MRRVLVVLAALAFFFADIGGSGAQNAGNRTNKPGAGAPEKRLAFVVGNESYAAGALPTAANDAGLIAQTLQAAGFEVIGARNLDAETLRQSYADFLQRVTRAGPGSVAFVYLSGFGLQYGNDNYFVPIGATIARGADIPIETVRLADLTGPLSSLNIKASFLVFDAAYRSPFTIEGAALAGFSLIDPSLGSLVAYNAAPGTVAPVSKGNYGVYAQSLAAELREGGVTPDQVFDRVRLRVSQESGGAEVPWDASKVDAAFRFFERGQGAPPTSVELADLTGKPLKDLPVKQAYVAALARDSVDSYSQFQAAYGSDPLARRARLLLAVRREAVTWRRTVAADTPAAYWSYLARYPRGPHAADARLRLSALSAPPAPPADYAALAYDVPPPPPDELPLLAAPIIELGDPVYDLPPPPPPPDYWLPPVPVEFVYLPPPPPPFGLFFLPIPVFVPIAAYFEPPPYVVYPANDVFYGGRGRGAGGTVLLGDRGVVNAIHAANGGAGTAAARGTTVAAGVALPQAAQQRAAALQRRGITTPEQLRAVRQQPGGVAEKLNQGGNALPNPRRAGPTSNARPASTAQRAAAPAAATTRRNASRPVGRAARAASTRVTPTRADATARRSARAQRAQQRQQRVAQRQARPARRVAARQAQRPRPPFRGAPVRAAAGRPAAPRPGGLAGPRPGGFAGPRLGGFAAPRPGGFAGPRPGGFAGPRPGGFAGPPPGGFGGGRPGGGRPAPAARPGRR